jgi:hypothetical protein
MKINFDAQNAVRWNAPRIVGNFYNYTTAMPRPSLSPRAKSTSQAVFNRMAQNVLSDGGGLMSGTHPHPETSPLQKRAPMKRFGFSLILAAGLLSSGAQALQPGIAIYNNATAFLADTSAASATGPLLSLSGNQYSAHIGSVTFSDVNGNGFWVGGLEAYTPADWTTLLPGNELAINSVENLNVTFDAPVFSAGFDFAEPGSQIGATSPSSPYANSALHLFYDSTFSVTLKQDGAVVGDFRFNAPDETASFVGVWSAAAFNRMEIREVSGGIEDDYFGQFYTGTAALPVPEPEPFALILCGVGLIMLQLRSRKPNTAISL